MARNEKEMGKDVGEERGGRGRGYRLQNNIELREQRPRDWVPPQPMCPFICKLTIYRIFYRTLFTDDSIELSFLA